MTPTEREIIRCRVMDSGAPLGPIEKMLADTIGQLIEERRNHRSTRAVVVFLCCAMVVMTTFAAASWWRLP